MTIDQLINLLFVEHWLFTTVWFPTATFAYAWVTDQTAWWVSSILWAVLAVGLAAKAKR